jgi:hypothetical protein
MNHFYYMVYRHGNRKLDGSPEGLFAIENARRITFSRAGYERLRQRLFLRGTNWGKVKYSSAKFQRKRCGFRGSAGSADLRAPRSSGPTGTTHFIFAE